jgi:predicted transcriptional regulator
MAVEMHASLRLAAPAENSALSLHRVRVKLPYVRLNDPAVRVMNDFTQEAPPTIDVALGLDDALDEMFRCGARAMLVTRSQQIVGLITTDDLRGECIAHSDYSAWREELCVGDVMIGVDDIPAIDWETLLDSKVSDLVEIFQGSGVSCLVVIQSESSAIERIRGLIHRSRLDLQLGARVAGGALL